MTAMGIEYLTGAEVRALAALQMTCVECKRRIYDSPHGWPVPPVNAAAIEPGDVAHAGDVVSGLTACGRDGSAWRWLVQRRPIEVERGR